jgi:glycosyltransferase involved in cell wall biosynthesis
VNPAGTVVAVVPQGIDDPLRPSGGNIYDQRVCQALAAAGWLVCVREVAGAWPWAGEIGRQALESVLSEVPDATLVLIDGLVASTVPEVIVPACHRLRVVVLMHMPIGCTTDREDAFSGERDVLRAAAAVVTTSSWSRNWLLTSYALGPAKVHVAHPGVDPAPPATGSGKGGALLCVGAVTPGKGHDVLLAALTGVAALTWRCTCVGALTVAPRFVGQLRRTAQRAGLEDRFLLRGPRTGSQLDAAYAEADVLVLSSRAETYGMVVTEALARGLPVIAAEVGGVSEALGPSEDGARPGLLTPPGDVTALTKALRLWLSDPDLRDSLRRSALERRAVLTDWAETGARVARVLAEVAA